MFRSSDASPKSRGSKSSINTEKANCSESACSVHHRQAYNTEYFIVLLGNAISVQNRLPSLSKQSTNEDGLLPAPFGSCSLSGLVAVAAEKFCRITPAPIPRGRRVGVERGCVGAALSENRQQIQSCTYKYLHFPQEVSSSTLSWRQLTSLFAVGGTREAGPAHRQDQEPKGPRGETSAVTRPAIKRQDEI